MRVFQIIYSYLSKSKVIIQNEGFFSFCKKIKRKIFDIVLHRKVEAKYFQCYQIDKRSLEYINKYDVIFCSIINWNFRYQRPQHIATKFAENGHRVFYLSIDLQQQKSYKVREIAEKIYEITIPFCYNTTIYDVELAEGIDVIKLAFKEIFADFSIKESITFVEFPLWAPVVSFLKKEFGSKVLFDCLDEYSGFDNVHVDIQKIETQLLKISDYCITTSDMLYQKHKKECENNALIRNATEFEHFNKCPENSLLEHVKKPIIGYYGAIGHWFDAEVVCHMARIKPDWSIVLIGHADAYNINLLKEHSNVYLLGEQPYSELPQYLFWFDVCIIPFKLVDLILSTNPVKFYEFMSAGKPVVSAELPELFPYKDYLYFAKNKDDFISQIDKALVEDNDDLKKIRIDLARQNDWQHRFQEINEIIHEVYPLVSIIIITYNNSKYNKLCIESIYSKTAYPNFELIIVDNASSDGTVEYLQEVAAQRENIKLILNKDNKGFAGGNNVGIKEAEGEFIILLNNDTIVTRGWISGLLKYLDDPAIGMVGPVTSWTGNEAKIEVGYSSPDGIEKFAEEYTSKHRNESFDIAMLAMFCVALRKSTVDKVGLLDEQFGVGMFEDDDYSYRIKQEGLRVVCAEDVFIHHFGRVSFSKIEQEKYQKIFEENREKYEQKWGRKWKPHIGRKN